MLTLSAFSFPARVTKRKLHFNCHSFASLTTVDSQRRSDIEDDRALTPLLREGVVSDQNELARLAHVSQSRMTQIMNLSHLAPEIQEAILFLSLVTSGRDPVNEKMLRVVAAEVSWGRQNEVCIALIS